MPIFISCWLVTHSHTWKVIAFSPGQGPHESHQQGGLHLYRAASFPNHDMGPKQPYAYLNSAEKSGNHVRRRPHRKCKYITGGPSCLPFCEKSALLHNKVTLGNEWHLYTADATIHMPRRNSWEAPMQFTCAWPGHSECIMSCYVLAHLCSCMCLLLCTWNKSTFSVDTSPHIENHREPVEPVSLILTIYIYIIYTYI